MPVNTTEVADYLTVVKNPIDLSTIEKRLGKALGFEPLNFGLTKRASFVSVQIDFNIRRI